MKRGVMRCFDSNNISWHHLRTRFHSQVTLFFTPIMKMQSVVRLKYIQAYELLHSLASAGPSSQPCMGSTKAKMCTSTPKKIHLNLPAHFQPEHQCSIQGMIIHDVSSAILNTSRGA